MDVENVFSSKPRMKIVIVLMQVGQLNVSEIAHKLQINYLTTRKHLRVLEDEGILQHTLYGRVRLFKLNHASPKTMAVQNLIEAWNHISDNAYKCTEA